MFSNIVIGYDGSPQSHDAVALARLLRDPAHGAVTAVNAYPVQATWFDAPGAGMYLDSLREQAEETLGEVRELLEGVPVRVRAVPDPSPARVLTAVAEDEDADLIVIGSTRHAPLGRILMGSTAPRVLHGAPCAVAVAPAGLAAEPRVPQRIAVAYDGSPEARAALDRAVALATELGASIELLGASGPHPVVAAGPGLPAFDPNLEEAIERGTRETLERAAAEVPSAIAVSTRLLVGSPVHVIAEAAADFGLLVTGSRSYGPLRRVLLGSTTSGLMHECPVPLLVTPRSALTDAG